jgi:acylphosphatase
MWTAMAVSEIQARLFVVSGHVQGVGFRFFVEAAARSLRLKGYVRNLNDGRVEVYASGSAAGLENLKRQMQLGPPASRVERIEERAAPGKSRYREFVIETTGEPSA